MTLRQRERHTDVNDIASDIEHEQVEISLAEHAKRMKRDQEPDANGDYAILDCVECGQEIGGGRLKAAIKNTLCIYCATKMEKRR